MRGDEKLQEETLSQRASAAGLIIIGVFTAMLIWLAIAFLAYTFLQESRYNDLNVELRVMESQAQRGGSTQHVVAVTNYLPQSSPAPSTTLFNVTVVTPYTSSKCSAARLLKCANIDGNTVCDCNE